MSRKDTTLDPIRSRAKLTFLIAAVCYLLFGLLLFLWPDLSQSIINTILAVICILFGVARLVIYFQSDRYEAMFGVDIILGVLGIAAGILILIFPKIIISLFPIVFGAFLLLSSIIKLQNAIDLKRIDVERWWIVLMMAVISAVFGILLIIHPFESGIFLIQLAGVLFMIDGVMSIYSILWLTYHARAFRKAMIDTEWEKTAKEQERIRNRVIPQGAEVDTKQAIQYGQTILKRDETVDNNTVSSDETEEKQTENETVDSVSETDIEKPSEIIEKDEEKKDE